MLGSLSNWLTWTTSTPKDEWTTWEEWQRTQPPSHFEKSDIFQYYLLYKPNFEPPENTVNKGHYSRYFNYCFGDFTILLVNPDSNRDSVEYLNLLLDVYDICKGFSRHITGDPTGIALVREAVSKRSFTVLETHDFNQYAYDYSIIHAHTVAQYSLSTLLMRFIGHYMNFVCNKTYFYPVMATTCQKAYNSYVFGHSSRQHPPITSDPINIRQNTSDTLKGLSWPRDQTGFFRCKICNRVSEKLWGSFNACLDCHVKRICSQCGAQAIVIGRDKFPKCKTHAQEIPM